ncbi:MaoC/PaaZ C-terminal domain-containing protein [Aeromicrobium sp. UC242_57]|uniref:MaoC/PaaZ C-terminal domain-containing protein n=1 Tax=Aeromicrobium sp. UC242_57 TaxID=3374624 RepID=UPI003796447B
MTLYFNQLEQGTSYTSSGRTVTEADIVAFAGLSGDFNPLHMDAEWVRENTGFGARIAHGLLILSISSGLRTPGLDDLAIQAYLNVDRRMSAPTFAGDTVHVVQTISGLKASSSKPGMGVVTLDVAVHKHDGTVVQQGTDVLLVAGDPDA